MKQECSEKLDDRFQKGQHFEKIVKTIVNFLGNPPGNRKRKNENEKNEEEDDRAEGRGEDVQLRLQVKHPGL